MEYFKNLKTSCLHLNSSAVILVLVLRLALPTAKELKNRFPLFFGNQNNKGER